jgi:hypothetical protein
MPNWEDYFTPLNREEQFSLKLTDILRINKQESEIEVWTDGVMIFDGKISDIKKDKITEEILNRSRVFSMRVANNKLVFFLVH